jgi:hypothetical protein
MLLLSGVLLRSTGSNKLERGRGKFCTVYYNRFLKKIMVYSYSYYNYILDNLNLLTRVRAQVKSCGICGEQSGAGACFL